MKIRTITLAVSSAMLAFVATPALSQSAAQAAYDAQLREYQRQQNDYQRARDSYDADMKRYQDDASYYADGYVPPVTYVPAAYVPFESLTKISDQMLINKPVQTLNGEYVGKITDVRAAGSLVTQMEVHINPARVTWVNSSRMRYDEVAGVVVTDLTADQMAGRSRIDW